VSFADAGARAPDAGPCGDGTGNAVSRAVRMTPQRELDPKCAGAATTAGDSLQNQALPVDFCKSTRNPSTPASDP
jgi:hypothetical protein